MESSFFVASEQLEELRRLQIQSDEEAQTLRQVAEEAGKLMLSVDVWYAIEI